MLSEQCAVRADHVLPITVGRQASHQILSNEMTAIWVLFFKFFKKICKPLTFSSASSPYFKSTTNILGPANNSNNFVSSYFF
jgi:hypothetical protein